MYRTIVIFPSSADPAVVDDLVAGMADSFKHAPGFRSMTSSVDGLMGPSARLGEHSRVVEADFDTLDDVMAALGAASLREVKEATEALDPTLLLWECVEI